MNTERKYIARSLFLVKIYELDGQAFEDFFVKIITLCNPKFRPVKPQGKFGDRKNDGFVREDGIYYQVYAPENPKNKDTALKSVTKLLKDFAGLKKAWPEIKTFNFVINDKYNGCYPDVELALIELGKENTETTFQPFIAKDLENSFLKLSDDDIYKIVGVVPDPENVGSLDYTALKSVISYLLEHRTEQSEGKLIAPNFEEKISFNKLSDTNANLLRQGSYQVYDLEKYFTAQSDLQREKLKEIYTDLYSEAKIKFNNITDANNDLIFSYILLNSTVPDANSQEFNAAVVLMSYYFENCDIFEEPKTK